MVGIIIKNKKDISYSGFERGYDPAEVKGRGLNERQVEAAIFDYTRDVALNPNEQRKLYDQYYDKNKDTPKEG
ncbi:MAG TPA: hypothetical protein VIJ14_00375 [Rhabdochlamydiaceae bacterium]